MACHLHDKGSQEAKIAKVVALEDHWDRKGGHWWLSRSSHWVLRKFILLALHWWGEP